MSDQEGKFIQLLLEEAMPILAYVLVGVLVALATKAFAWLRLQVGEKQWTAIEMAVDFAIRAAEQSGATAGWLKQGKDKKAYALALAQAALDKQGIKVNVAELEAKIEAAVYDAYFPHKSEDVKADGAGTA